MDFLVLGPLTVVSDGSVPLDLGPPKARAVLAVLLCFPGRIVSLNAIVDALWPDNPPPAAVKNVQLYVHRLRRALGDAGRIRRQARGYVLAVAPEEIDAGRFAGLIGRHRAAADAGDWEASRSALVQALDLWRSEQAFSGVDDVPPVAAEGRRLAEARLAALKSRIDADLRLGRHDELVPELVALTGEYRLHEGFWAQLMTALDLSGRRAEALSVFDAARRVIAEETGLDPGATLRDLQRAILVGDPEGAAPPDVRQLLVSVCER